MFSPEEMAVDFACLERRAIERVRLRMASLQEGKDFMIIDYAQDSPGKMHGIPDFLRRDTPEKVAACAKSWEGRRQMPVAAFIEEPAQKALSPEAIALQAELDAQAALKTGNRIKKMLVKKASKVVDRTGQRWDARHNKWVSALIPTSAVLARANQAKREASEQKI